MTWLGLLAGEMAALRLDYIDDDDGGDGGEGGMWNKSQREKNQPISTHYRHLHQHLR